MSIRSSSCVIGIVVPLYKHSVLLVDALLSAIQQESRYPFAIIVVNDGCPYLESNLQVKSVQAASSVDIRYVVQRNQGLSAARNTGIEYALAEFPGLQAIYFMDADNIILPQSIDAAYSRLIEDEDTSWIYPNIDMFGIKANFDYGGPYSLLRHTQYNICEAGSLVHRRVLDAGVRFDEQMKLGYEDWDFWLSAAAHGFRGAHHPHFGFRYRNRGESMLSQSRRDSDEIHAYLKKKHRRLLSTRSLMRLESIEALRYAILFIDTSEVLLTSGNPGPEKLLPEAEFEELFWRNVAAPSRQYMPPFLVLMTRPVYEALSQSGLLQWLLHDSEVVLKEMNLACTVIELAQGHTYQVNPGGKVIDASVLVVGRELVHAMIRDRDAGWIERMLTPEPGMKVSARTVTIPGPDGTTATARVSAILAFLTRIQSWRSSPYLPAANRSWIWREVSASPTQSMYLNVRAAFGDEVVYPMPMAAARNIGFILPIASFGGVERVAYNLAEQFAQAGWQVHLFVIGQTRIDVPHGFANSFATLHFLCDAAFGSWDQESLYQGTSLSAARKSSHAMYRIVAALAWLDAVINCHSGELNAAAGHLRYLGVTTAAHVHLLDQSPAGRSQGHPLITLAYEHAYDLVCCNSRQLMAWMNGAGIPAQKLIYVPNAPGHPVQEAKRDAVLLARRSSTDKRLNALFVGRLDRQKGLDRLASVVEATRDLDLPVDWRIVGSSVARDTVLPPALRDLVEPAVFDDEQLTSLFAWADVMVLLSDFEGVPLSVLEARRLGVIVIATNVGALSEVVTSGKTGFLIEPEAAVEETVSLLRLLIEAPGLRAKMTAAASQITEWPEAAAALIERMSSLVEAKLGLPAETADPMRASAVN